MKIRKNSLVLAAAFTGLLAGTTTRLSAAPAASNSFAGQFAANDDKKADKKADKDKNTCKGKGGCGGDSSKTDSSKKDKTK